MLREGKYARIERERRFLVGAPPPASAAVRVMQITDRYLSGTRLRLRRIQHLDSDDCTFKLTQKLPADVPGHVQGLITNMYLDQAEYDLLATLPAAVLTKTRLSLPPMGVDVFDGPLAGLVLAEAEFTCDADAVAFVPPGYCIAEVTDDLRFTGGLLVATGRSELDAWLAELGSPPDRR